MPKITTDPSAIVQVANRLDSAAEEAAEMLRGTVREIRDLRAENARLRAEIQTLREAHAKACGIG